MFMTESQTNQLVALRPLISTEASYTDVEQFQNETLRPILKLLNNTLLYVFRQYIEKHKSPFSKFSVIEKQAYVVRSLRQDHQFRHFVRGIVAGHFTNKEWVFFDANENEVNKRIMKMIEQRLNSQLEELSEK